MSLVFPHTFVPWFRSVAPYIHAYHGKTFVVALVGEAIAAGKLNAFVQDLAILQAMGIKLVLVHGFRPQVNEQLAAKGHVSRFSHGQRITDGVALDCAQEAAGQLRFEIEAAFSQGLPNTPMANATVRVLSGNFLTARPVGIVDGIDFMHSGVVRHVDAATMRRAIDGGALVLLSPFGFSPTGEAFNLMMEDVATATAIALQADKLLFVTEVSGIRENLEDPESEIDTELALVDARRLMEKLPEPNKPGNAAFYLRHCVRACEGGVERSHILPFAVDGAILQEVFTHDGIGTMVVDEKLESVHEAGPDDVASILALIEPFERDGTLVKRGRTEIERDIGNYTVIEHDGVIFGCAALYPYPEAHTGEMAALTVSGHVQGQGDGERLLKRIEQRARSMGLESIFVLTTRTMHWFIKRGFQQVDPDWLPEARKRKYNWDRRSQVLVKKLASSVDRS
ncbi:MAG: amino-acid N-acetyltransferase [Ideonella sp.]|nr:amino-acid N-acetyltransferase [Ideonella sp.]MCC7457545.1 amino-acid N-acetyltransferase [Nitrospira sp.]